MSNPHNTVSLSSQAMLETKQAAKAFQRNDGSHQNRSRKEQYMTYSPNIYTRGDSASNENPTRIGETQ